MDSQASLLAQIQAGNRQLQMLAAGGLLPLPFEQLVPLQVLLAGSDEAEVADRAASSLAAIDVRLAVAFLAGEAGAEVLSYFATALDHPLYLEAVLRRRDVPRSLLIEVAPRLSADLQEVLLLRQDAIVEEPEILDALASNPQISPYTLRRIGEYREHLVRRERAAPIPGEDFEAEEEMDDAAFAAALAEVRAAPVVGEIDEQSKLSEGQIRMLPLPARIKLTRGASRVVRNILIRDPSPRVAISVITNNALSEQEVEQVVRNRSVIEDVLMYISRKKEYANKPNIQRGLAQNPRTPLGVAMKIVPRLAVKDLRDLAKDRNIPEAVRTLALRLYRMKRS